MGVDGNALTYRINDDQNPVILKTIKTYPEKIGDIDIRYVNYIGKVIIHYLKEVVVEVHHDLCKPMDNKIREVDYGMDGNKWYIKTELSDSWMERDSDYEPKVGMVYRAVFTPPTKEELIKLIDDEIKRLTTPVEV